MHLLCEMIACWLSSPTLCGYESIKQTKKQIRTGKNPRYVVDAMHAASLSSNATVSLYIVYEPLKIHVVTLSNRKFYPHQIRGYVDACVLCETCGRSGWLVDCR